MAVLESDLAAYVGASEGEAPEILSGCLTEAYALVNKFNVKRYPDTGAWGPSDAPFEIVDRAVLEVAADLWNRRSAPNGIRNGQFENFGGDQGVAVRIARDPMQAAYKILGRWVSP